MAITEQQNERLTLLLEALEPETKKMDDRSRGFVEDQIHRHQQYGERILISPKQWAWLESLYQKHVGALAELPSDKSDRDDTLGNGDDIDDEIPF